MSNRGKPSEHHQHRPGSLRQANKPHGTAGRSKSRRRAVGGRTAETSQARGNANASKEGAKAKAGNVEASRQRRRQISDEKKGVSRMELQERRRGVGSVGAPPRIVVPLWLGETTDALGPSGNAVIDNVIAIFAREAGATDTVVAPGVTSTLLYSPAWKQYLQVVRPVDCSDLLAVSDAVLAADVVLMILPLAHGDGTVGGISDDAQEIISLIKSQGIPSVVGTAIDTGVQLGNNARLNHKKAVKTCLKEVKSQFERAMPVGTHCKFQALVSPAGEPTSRETQALLRTVVNIPSKSMPWRETRPYMLVDNVGHCSVAGPDGASTMGLALTGFIRGSNLDANRLFHITHIGSYQIAEVREAESPTAGGSLAGIQALSGNEALPVVAVPNPELQDSLQTVMEADPFAADQTHLSEHEVAEAEQQSMAMLQNEHTKRVMNIPEGTSTYQANWFVSSSEDEGGSDDEMGEEDDDMGDAHAASTDPWVNPMQQHPRASGPDDDDDIDLQNRAVDALDDVEFADEVRVPDNQSARIRYQKYRGIKSFRDSYWDPKESLPHEYARIIQFDRQNQQSLEVDEFGEPIANRRTGTGNAFSGINKAVLEQQLLLQVGEAAVEHVAAQGSYVTIILRGLSGEALQAVQERHQKTGFLLGSGLLQFENMVSVLHVQVTALSRARSVLDPATGEQVEYVAKSKDPMLLSIGFRRIPCRPVLSEANPQGDKHKYEKFLHARRTVVASIYGPVTFPTGAPVVLTTDPSHTAADRDNRVRTVSFAPDVMHHDALAASNPVFLASGSVLTTDPDRIMLKRIILTGAPLKVHKKVVTVRGMFYDPDDVRWFKPVELRTKYGRLGHISEPLGTHGLMKCRFDMPILQHDTVLLTLYKRIYPVWRARWNVDDHSD